MNFGSGGNMDAKAWRDIWGCGQGIGVIHDVPSVAELVERLSGQLAAARAALEDKLAMVR
jgi:nitronate monooxygenase